MAGAGAMTMTSGGVTPRSGPALALTLALASGLAAASACGGGDLALPGDGMPARVQAVQGDNQTAVIGAELPQPLVVRVLDADGQPVAGAALEWSVEGGGSLAAAASSTDADGRAAARRVLGMAAGAASTIAAVDGADSLRVTFTAVALPPTAPEVPALVLATEPSSEAVLGERFERQPVVRLVDSQGRPLARSGVTVTAAIAAGGGTLSGTTSRSTGSEGVATFTDLAIDGSAGTRLLIFAAAGYASLTSGPVAVSAPPAPPPPPPPPPPPGQAAVALDFLVEPSDVVVGRSIRPAVQVTIVDKDGARVRSAEPTVRMDVQRKPGGGVLQGTTSVKAKEGIAVFTDLRVNLEGEYTLRATSEGLTAAESRRFDAEDD